MCFISGLVVVGVFISGLLVIGVFLSLAWKLLVCFISDDLVIIGVFHL